MEVKRESKVRFFSRGVAYDLRWELLWLWACVVATFLQVEEYDSPRGLCCNHRNLGTCSIAMQISGLHFNGCILGIRLQRAGIPSPKVVLLCKHILIMSFIGQDTVHVPAPKLKEANLTPDQMNDTYKQCTEVSLKWERVGKKGK